MSERFNDRSPPRALILTLLGAYIRRLDGWISIAGIIKAAGELGVDSQSVRSAVSRLKRRGLVAPARRWNIAGYVLTPAGNRMVQLDELRAFGLPRTATLQDGWVVVVFSVPDARKSDRHSLRSQLERLGFGLLGSAVWLAPWHVASEAKEMLIEGNLDQYAYIFQARYDAFGEPADLVAQSWNLNTIEAAYREFHATVEPIAARWRRRGSHDDRQALIDHMTVLTAWRPLTYVDAGLPADALPRSWPRPAAWDLFHELIGRLEEQAIRYMLTITGPAEIGESSSRHNERIGIVRWQR